MINECEVPLSLATYFAASPLFPRVEIYADIDDGLKNVTRTATILLVYFCLFSPALSIPRSLLMELSS